MIAYLPLESYRERYTELLSCAGGWTESCFSASKVEFRSLRPWSDVRSIESGEVLDASTRCRWALEQSLELSESAASFDAVYFEDFFHPGIETLPYVDRSRRSKSFAYLWAQSFDRYDFTARMGSWMRRYEEMALSILDGVFVASELLAELIATAVPSAASKIHVVGLPFDSAAVARLSNAPSRPSREIDVVYSSRWDSEKEPDFFMDLVELMPHVRFAVCTGWPRLRGTASRAIERAERARAEGRLSIYDGLSKPSYYNVLKDSRVQFNCALQDWVSFTLLEALSFGCLPLYPSRRSFPEALGHREAHLYRPRDVRDAAGKLACLLEDEVEFDAPTLSHHDGSLSRIAAILSR